MATWGIRQPTALALFTGYLAPLELGSSWRQTEPLSLWRGGVMAVPFPCESDTHCLSFGFRCDPSEINISDEMPKTTVWKALSINSGNTKEKR